MISLFVSCATFTGRMHAKEAMEKREPIMPSNHFIKTFFESFAEDPIFNSVDKEKEGDVDETENPPGKTATNKYVPWTSYELLYIR